MRVSDIYEEVKEATGTCEEAVNFRAITRAVELLANEGLFDPLIGTLDFHTGGSYYVALPRDVKTPIRVNINNNPSFARSRIFEFSPNTDGTNDGEEVGWQWHERGYTVIQNLAAGIFPTQVACRVSVAQDIGAAMQITGIDVDDRLRSETLIGNTGTPSLYSAYAYKSIQSVIKPVTLREVSLVSLVGHATLANYYPDEEQPEYRLIKLSKTGVAVRILYRKKVFKISAQTDIIPLHSPMAVIRAVDAVRLMQQKKYDLAAPVLAMAVSMIGKEQATRDEGETISSTLEIQTAINANINTNDVLIVADVYDMAADIIGPVGRQKIFDRLTDAINALANKGQWDSMLGTVDVWRANNYADPSAPPARRGSYFVLPRYVQAALAVNVSGRPGIPRNRWFEFHLNGTGSRHEASGGAWDDAGDAAIINGLPHEEHSRRIAARRVIAIPDNNLDADTSITIFGIERLSDGREVEVYRNGAPGWTCPCKPVYPPYALPDGSPYFTRVDRITKHASAGFIKLWTVEQNYAPGVDATPASSDISTVDDAGSLQVVLNDPSPANFTIYGFYDLTNIPLGVMNLYSDETRTHLVLSVESPTSGMSVTVGAADFGGAVDSIELTFTDFGGGGPALFVTSYVVTPETPATPALPLVTGELLGYWYPDELEPRYRMIKVAGCRSDAVRIRYRQRSAKVTSLHDVINLRSRLALENMLRALSNQATNPQNAAFYEGLAMNYLDEEQRAANPIMAGGLQFDPGTAPGHTHNIQ